MTGEEFAQALALRLGLPPLSEAEIATLLSLASVGAHSSERLAAPLCTYLAGKAGADPGEVLSVARAMADGADH